MLLYQLITFLNQATTATSSVISNFPTYKLPELDLSVFLTKENITFFLATIGSVGTICSGIHACFSRRIQLSVSVKDWNKPTPKVAHLFLLIQNNSSKPTIISGISILKTSQEYYCRLDSKKIITDHDVIIRATPQFPLNLFPHQGVLFAFEFLDCPDIELTENKTVDLQIYTNQKAIRKSVTLPKQSHYLRAIKR